jgi:N-acetylmuramoyl-L-alanine amidase
VEFIHADKDEGNTDESLASRLKAYVNAGVDAFVSIHHNAFTGSWNGATGVEVYTDKNATTSDLRLADCIYGRLVNHTKLRGRGIKKANWYVIDQNRIPAVLVEGGFMDGTNDYKVITSEEGQNAYAKAVAEGLIEFLGLTKKEVSQEAPTKSLDDWANEVKAGKHGNGHANREASLKNAGCPYPYAEVRARVNATYGVKTSTPTPTPTKSLDDWAKEVRAGKHGNGHATRKASLKKAGCPYDYEKVRARVNAMY